MSEWQKVRFDQLASPDRWAFSIGPFGSKVTTSDYREDGIPFIRGVNLAQGIFLDEGFVFISEEKAKEIESALVKPGDIVFTRKGTVGQVSMIPRNPRYEKYAISGSQVKSRVDERYALPEFYYYWFRSPAGQHNILEHAVTTGVPSLANSLQSIRGLMVPKPPLAEQSAVVKVLEALDDKIAVNERIAATARSLSRAKAAGALLSASGSIGLLGDHVEVTKGLSYRSTDLVPGDGHLVTLKCIDPTGAFKQNGLKPFSGVAKPAQIVKHGDVVVAQTDLTQRADVLGRSVRVAQLCGRDRLVASLDLAIVRPRGFLTPEYIDALFTSREFREHALSYANGTTVLHLGSRAIPEFSFTVPDGETVAAVTRATHALFETAVQAQREASTLSTLRDTLLPQLMSGRLRVKDAEKIVEDRT
ncbi:restriction endonuclease subunit S [Streptomyces mirabilis]|uniref:restriction endonuclease subunit S n=1 Tax=Streptomyces mirabilis TaxID=68239 RepID=UPI0036BE3ECB